MSDGNAEIVRRVYDAFAGGDGDTPYELYSEDIVWDMSKSTLYDEPVYHGHEGVRRVWRETFEVFGEVDFEIGELTETGDKVLVVLREIASGRSSGAPVESAHVAVWTLAEGLITRLEIFDDRANAAAAAGLT